MRLQGQLELRLSSLPGAVAKSFEGVATAEIDISVTQATGKAQIKIAPPPQANKMAAMIREMIFPGGSIRTFDFDFPKSMLKYAGAIALLGAISVTLTGSKKKGSGGIRIVHESIPEGVELTITLAPSARTENLDESKKEEAGNHWLITPRPRIFGTAGYGSMNGKSSFTSTIGADFPLFYDTKTPIIYGGLGLRGTVDSNKALSVGGSFLAGLNLDPLSLQMGIGAGVAFLPNTISTEKGPAQTVVYYAMEGSVSYKIIPHVELMLLLSAGGSKEKTSFGTAQLGVGGRF